MIVTRMKYIIFTENREEFQSVKFNVDRYQIPGEILFHKDFTSNIYDFEWIKRSKKS